jgi:hypothetical protein
VGPPSVRGPPGPPTAPWIPPRDWGRDWFFLPWASYSTDYGVFLGGGFATRSYGFRQDPYASQHALRAGGPSGRASRRSPTTASSTARAPACASGSASYSGLEVLRYYGFGNETVAAEDDDFNKVRQRQLTLAPSLTLPLGGPVELTVAPALQYAKDEEGDRLVDQERPYGYGEFGQVGGWVRLRLDTRQPLRRPRGAACSCRCAAARAPTR